MSKFLNTLNRLSRNPAPVNTDFTPIPRKPPSVTPTPPAPIPVAPTPSTPIPLEAILSELDVGKPARSRGKVIRAKRIQDGHSATQDAIYWYLWREGKHVQNSRSRFVQAGYGQIQSALSVNRSNVQDAIKELQKKFSIRMFREGSASGGAAIYEVLCCDDVLDARKTAGMIWAFRYGTRRADLLQDPDLTPTGLTPIGLTPTGVKPTGGMGATPTPGMGVTPIQLVNKQKEQNDSGLLSSSVAIVRKAMADATEQTVDDDEARDLITRVRQTAADATQDEILHFIRHKAKAVRKYDNRPAALVVSVSKCFQLESLADYRKGREVDKQPEPERSQTVEELKALIEEIDAVLHDETTNESQKAGMAAYRDETHAKLVALRKAHSTS